MKRLIAFIKRLFKKDIYIDALYTDKFFVKVKVSLVDHMYMFTYEKDHWYVNGFVFESKPYVELGIDSFTYLIIRSEDLKRIKFS